MRESRTYGSVRARPNGGATRPPSSWKPLPIAAILAYFRHLETVVPGKPDYIIGNHARLGMMSLDSKAATMAAVPA
jgi:hypothetical protein